MNAVKRCQALIAATLLIGSVACGEDPTAGRAGKDLSIRATPGAVWMRNNTSATVNIEAVDGLGGPVEGSWAVGTIVGPFTAKLDTLYQNSYNQNDTVPTPPLVPLGVKARFIVTPTAEGEGSVVFSGTGGSITVPIRVAPDTNAFNVVFSTATPAIGNSFTATAPAGTRFTAGTTINFYSGPLTLNLSNGLAAPSIVGYNADSTVMTILPAPGASGQIRFTGVASVSTPGLTTTARSTGTVTVPVLSSVAAVFTAAPAANADVTVTMPANFKFRPTSVLTNTGSTITPVVKSRSADSNSVVILPVPSTTGVINITAVQLSSLPTLSLGLPTTASMTVGAASNLGADDPVASPSFAAPTVTGTAIGWYDLYTMTQPDPSPTCDGAAAAQFYTLTVSVTGSYTIQMNWSNGSDFDFGIMVKDGTYAGGGTPATACNDYLSTSGLASSKPESITVNLTAATTYVINAMDYAGNGSGFVQIKVLKN